MNSKEGTIILGYFRQISTIREIAWYLFALHARIDVWGEHKTLQQMLLL